MNHTILAQVPPTIRSWDWSYWVRFDLLRPRFMQISPIHITLEPGVKPWPGSADQCIIAYNWQTGKKWYAILENGAMGSTCANDKPLAYRKTKLKNSHVFMTNEKLVIGFCAQDTGEKKKILVSTFALQQWAFRLGSKCKIHTIILRYIISITTITYKNTTTESWL